MEWNWWVSQGLALLGLVFVVIAMQQRETKPLLWYRVIAVTVIVIGLCFLGNVSAIILGGSGLVQLFVALLFAYKPSIKPEFKLITAALLAVSVIALNIIFWGGYLSIMAMVYGVGALAATLQKKASTIRKLTVIICMLGIVYYGLLLAPINAVMEGIALISAAVGIIRLDIKRERKEATTEEPKEI